MFYYRICGHTFCSTVQIRELHSVPDQEPKFTFRLHKRTGGVTESPNWSKRWYSTDGKVWLAFAKIEEGYLLRFPEYADFVISENAKVVDCYMQKRCPLKTMRHLLLNQVIPLVLNQFGHLVLHASACVTPHGVIAFLGMTGMGKSTLATSFGLLGYQVLTDDCLLIENQAGIMMTVSSYPGLRLWPESVSALLQHDPILQPLAHYTDKKRLLLEQDQIDDFVPLKAIYILDKPKDQVERADVTITSLNASEALLETIKHIFQLDTTDRKTLGRAFRQYEELVKAVPFFKLTYPRDFALLANINNTILNHIGHIQSPEQIPG